MDLNLSQMNIPTDGIKQKKIASYVDLIERYLADNDKYNNQAVYGGLFPALAVLAKDKPLIEVMRSMDTKLSGFQLNWIFNTLSEYAIRGEEVKKVWSQYQKSVEPKKKPSRKNRSSQDD